MYGPITHFPPRPAPPLPAGPLLSRRPLAPTSPLTGFRFWCRVPRCACGWVGVRSPFNTDFWLPLSQTARFDLRMREVIVTVGTGQTGLRVTCRLEQRLPDGSGSGGSGDSGGGDSGVREGEIWLHAREGQPPLQWQMQVQRQSFELIAPVKEAPPTATIKAKASAMDELHVFPKELSGLIAEYAVFQGTVSHAHTDTAAAIDWFGPVRVAASSAGYLMGIDGFAVEPSTGLWSKLTLARADPLFARVLRHRPPDTDPRCRCRCRQPAPQTMR
jgi:hypothetical protein